MADWVLLDMCAIAHIQVSQFSLNHSVSGYAVYFAHIPDFSCSRDEDEDDQTAFLHLRFLLRAKVLQCSILGAPGQAIQGHCTPLANSD